MSILREGRTPAPPPKWPESLKELAALPPEVDEYLKDRFGLRDKMIRAHKDLMQPVTQLGNSEVLLGRNGHLYLFGGDVVRQSAGLILRDQRVANAADLLAAMRDELSRRGIGLFVAVPPSSSTVYQDDLPIWAQSNGRKTEYDLVSRGPCSARHPDGRSRPALSAAASQGKAYLMHDTHWTARGAVAGFNAVVEADGHPEWRLDPLTALGNPAEVRGGDLARVLGVQDEVSEEAETLALVQNGTDEILSEGAMPDHVVTTGKPARRSW